LLAVSACAGAFALCGAAQAHSIGAAPGRTPGASQEVAQSPPRTCVIHSLSSFVAQGEFGATATVADVVEVECNPMIFGTGSKIKITASQLFSLCKGSLTWYVANPFRTETGRGIAVELDADFGLHPRGAMHVVRPESRLPGDNVDNGFRGAVRCDRLAATGQLQCRDADQRADDTPQSEARCFHQGSVCNDVPGNSQLSRRNSEGTGIV